MWCPFHTVMRMVFTTSPATTQVRVVWIVAHGDPRDHEPQERTKFGVVPLKMGELHLVAKSARYVGGYVANVVSTRVFRWPRLINRIGNFGESHSMVVIQVDNEAA